MTPFETLDTVQIDDTKCNRYTCGNCKYQKIDRSGHFAFENGEIVGLTYTIILDSDYVKKNNFCLNYIVLLDNSQDIQTIQGGKHHGRLMHNRSNVRLENDIDIWSNFRCNDCLKATGHASFWDDTFAKESDV